MSNLASSARPSVAATSGGLDSPRFLAEAGYLALYEGRASEARTIFQGLEQLAPSDALPKLGLAECALAESDSQGARELARSAARMPGCDLGALLFAYWLQAKAAIQSGDADEVRELAGRMLELDPDGPWSASVRTLMENY